MTKLMQSVYVKIRTLFKKIYRGNFYYFFWVYPVKKNKIVISNYYGKGYGDNSKYIVENILERNLDFEIVWLIDNNIVTNIPIQVRQVKYRSFTALFELATAKFWIDNCRKIYFPPKRREQYYIQTWHGNFPLKRIEKDAENSLGEDYIYTAKQDSVICDYFISNSAFMTNLYKSSFWFFGSILELGSPRNDVFFKDSLLIRKKVLEYFNLNLNSKILLYAPTFRKVKNISVFIDEFNSLKMALQKKFGSEWIILVRLHPNDADIYHIYQNKGEVINASNYPDMQELLLVSDALITDYSSSMFDYILSKKPCFLYMSDLNEYTNDRNFYFDLDDIPFPKSKDKEDLVSQINDFNYNLFRENIDNFINKYSINDKGNASSGVVNFILEKCEEKK